VVIRLRNEFEMQPHMDVYPGEHIDMNTVVRFDSDPNCFGWCNENHFSDPPWRNQNYELPHGRFLIKVVVLSSAGRHEATFLVANDRGRADFRLESVPASLDGVIR
jgi:hypothetical protein